MRIVVCVKPVPEAESRLRATADGVAPDPDGVKFVLAGYDESAVEQGEESWEVPLPCAVGLQQAWNDPRTASLPAILRSRKASIAHRAVAGAPAPGPASAPARFALPPPRQGAKMIEYRTPAEAAERLVRLLREEAKVFP